jgi:hypothetical protein
MLESEADVLRTLQAGTYTLEQLYELCEQRTEVARQGGHDPVPEHAGDRRWKRREYAAPYKDCAAADAPSASAAASGRSTGPPSVPNGWC